MIKTIQKRERDVLIRMLPTYEDHMGRGGSDSFLTRFLGVYDLERRKGWGGRKERTTVVVINSVFPVDADFKEVYDLKGSTVGRRTGGGGRNAK